MFFTNGVLFAALLPRYPEIKAAFSLSNSEFGLVVVAFPMGALLAAALAGRVIRRFGTLRTNASGSVALAAGMAMAGVSADAGLGVAAYVVAMLVAGATDAVVDAAQNVQGVLVEQWRERSVVNSFHALWSIGAATGGLIGAGAVAADVSISTQMIANSAIWAVVAVVACRLAVVPPDVREDLRAEQDRARGGSDASPHRPWRLLLPLVALAVAGTTAEEVANSWSVLYLARDTAAPAAVASLGLTVAIGAQFVGRLLGDPMTDRWGRSPVARSGGLLIAAGGVLVVAAPGYPLVLAGFALAGFGSATLVPAAFAAAGRLPGLPEGTGIAILGWLMRIGFLVTSPAIGGVSDLVSLQAALGVLVLAGAVTTLLARRLPST
ncbi:MFS transporter [Aeromicrobium sp.]|uniref:MFS transporter n=1 Tax=Aeromicrobium sp. TaxID=1871063 RepID=UPI0025C1EF4C|nr:MFS transporter [Aeromicrobium sp.]MCK5890250.1 MFS transporter [Aeromicrobium sp.]